MLEPKQPDPLIEARELFRTQNYEQSKKKLQEVKNINENIELNLFLVEYKINPANNDIVLKALMDTLTSINIKLFKDMGSLIKNQKSNKNPIKYISHEFFYWNIIIIAQQIGKPSIASLMGHEALHFSSSFRSKTALMIIYEMLKQMACQNRLASCGSLVMKFKEIFQKAKKFSTQQEIYRAMNHIMWTKIFLRLGFLEESVHMYMQKLGQSEQQLFASSPLVLPFDIYKQFLHAQIEYFKQNYKTSLKVLGQILQKAQQNSKIDKFNKQKIKNMAESNIAAVMMSMNKVSISRKLILKTNDYFRKTCHQGIDNERYLVYERSKQLLFYSFLKANQKQLSRQDYNRAFHLMSKSDSNKSYKLFYRKGQLCMNYFHKIIKDYQSNLPYKQIIDKYECCYYYPNDPYFQSKGKNKNPLYNQGKRYYRRYAVSDWDCKGDQQKKNQAAHQKNDQNLTMHVQMTEPNDFSDAININSKQQDINDDKPQKKKRKGSNFHHGKDKKNFKQFSQDQGDKKRTKSQPKQKQQDTKSTSFTRKGQQASQMAFKSITYFKQSLSLLEQQKKVILTFTVQEPHTDLTERVNLKLYQDYRVFKQSILMNLCYLYLYRQNWVKVIEHAEMYRKFVAYDKSSNTFQTQNIKKAHNQQQYYCVLSYEMEAYCQINKFSHAYETMQDIVQTGYSQTIRFEACSSINLSPQQCKLEQTNQYHNLLYNITVLHSRDNHLPQAHQSLQKILSQTNLLPNRSSFKTPLSVNDLLLHYHLRTQDRCSALEILKRRRVMGMGGVNGVFNVLKVTK